MWNLYKIPKVAHFYWGSPMLSYLRYLTLVTFRKQNPDWTMKFYYPSKVYTGGAVWNQGFAEQVTGKNYFDNIKNIPNIEIIELDFDKMNIGYIPDVFRSDILRLKLLSTEGGLWSDIDIVYFRPMDECLFNNEKNKEIDTVISYNRQGGHYSIGFLLSSPNNEFYSFLYEESMKEKQEKGEYQHLGITMWDKNFKKPEDIKKKFPSLSLFDIEMWLTYSLNSFHVDKIINQNVSLPDERSIALHWYGGHWKCVPLESSLTPNNISNFDNTLCHTIKRALL